MKKRVYLFDVDGTLINCGGAGKKALRHTFLKQYDVDISDRDISFSGRTDLNIINSVARAFQIEISDHGNLLREYFYTLEQTVRENSYVLDGVNALMKTLCTQDCVLGLITGNIYEAARIKLEYFDLFRYFTFGVYGDISENRDDLARMALRRLIHLYDRTFAHEDIYIVGDTVHDIRCGKSIKCRTLAVASGNTDKKTLLKEKPYACIESLENTQQIIRILSE